MSRVTEVSDKLHALGHEKLIDALDELESARTELAELRGISTLAFRTLNDVGPVLATIDGDDYTESAMLAELIGRVKACSMNLWCVLRYPTKPKTAEVEE